MNYSHKFYKALLLTSNFFSLYWHIYLQDTRKNNGLLAIFKKIVFRYIPEMINHTYQALGECFEPPQIHSKASNTYIESHGHLLETIIAKKSEVMLQIMNKIHIRKQEGIQYISPKNWIEKTSSSTKPLKHKNTYQLSHWNNNFKS